MKRNPRAQAKLNEKLSNWQRWCPVGTTLVYRELQDGPVTLIAKTRSQVEILSGHSVVVWLEGKSGCVCVDHCQVVQRFITPEQEVGLVSVGWSWEQYGGMLNCFPTDPGWSRRTPERNAYWTEKGFTAPRELFFQTPLQKAAPDLLEACKGLLERYRVMGCGDGIEARAAELAIASAMGGQA